MRGLVIGAYAVLPLSILRQRFKLVAGIVLLGDQLYCFDLELSTELSSVICFHETPP